MEKTFGEMLRELRRRQSPKISISRLARDVGVTRSYLCQVERGEKCPGPEILANMLNALKVPRRQRSAIYELWVAGRVCGQLDLRHRVRLHDVVTQVGEDVLAIEVKLIGPGVPGPAVHRKTSPTTQKP